jgi:N-acetylmuramoyl-L-alanine amidase
VTVATNCVPAVAARYHGGAVKHLALAAAASATCVAAAAWGLRPTHRSLEQVLTWPAEAAVVVPPTLGAAPGEPSIRLYLDAGHGAPDNSGNLSSLCEEEQDFTLALADEVAAQLRTAGGFEVRVSRAAGELVAYVDRVAEAERWSAHAFVSLHSDVRGEAELWSPPARTERCMRSRSQTGFSVLWSDEGSDALVAARRDLARSLAESITGTGLPPYVGADYRGLYQPDERQPGVFADRHSEGRRIFVLRRPAMPSVIIETHNARDDREVIRWRQPRVRRAFAAALADGLVRALR